MNKFVNSLGVGATQTTNGAFAYESSGSALVDFFYLIGSARSTALSVVIQAFEKAFAEFPVAALKLVFWARDVRGGAGEREVFRQLIAHIDSTRPVLIARNIENIPEYGRWDDLWNSVQSSKTRTVMKQFIAKKLFTQDESYGLLCKWLPRSGNFAAEMREYLKLTPKQWRKMVVAGSQTVEQKMCAKEWDQINHEHTPSVASSRYMAAFNKHSSNGDDNGNYTLYKSKLATGEVKINASAIFPHEIAKNAKRDHENKNLEIIEAQWNSLPNFLEGSKENILPMIDVSGSMECPVGNNPNMQCIDVSTGLGAYVALKQKGAFNGMYLTFHTEPSLLRADPMGGVSNMLRQIYNDPCGGSTDIWKAFDLILEHAHSNNVPLHEMPTMVIVFSDMQFDVATNQSPAYETISTKYAMRGYKLPKLVFWNLRAEYGTTEVGANKSGTMLVSGFSPAILKAIVTGEDMPEVPSPIDLVMSVVNSERYSKVHL